MKKRVSATVDEKTIKEIEKLLKKGKYRNKSHIIEEAVKVLSNSEKGKKVVKGGKRYCLVCLDD